MRRIAFFVVSLVTAPLVADELRLTDGRTIVGKVKEAGETLIVETRDGSVEIALADIASRRTEAELRAALKKLAKSSGKSAFHQLELAKTAFEWGLTKSMWDHLGRCQKRLDRRVEKRYRRFLAGLEPEVLPAKYRTQDTRGRVRGLCKQVRKHTKAARRDAVLEVLVGEPNADQSLAFCARRESFPEQRLVALHALARRGAASTQQELCRSIVLDKDKSVRVAVADLIRDHGDAHSAIRYLAPGFLADHPSIRGRTAQAFGYLADMAGAPYLVAAGPLAGVRRADTGNIGVRASMFQITSRAYIRDFEVEIAQAAAVANPVIGNADNGVVLDVKVGGVTSMRGAIVEAYRRALKKLTGSDPGKNPALWDAWWEKHRPGSAQAQGQQSGK